MSSTYINRTRAYTKRKLVLTESAFPSYSRSLLLITTKNVGFVEEGGNNNKNKNKKKESLGIVYDAS